MQETWVWSLGCEDPLVKGMATHSSIVAWRIPWTEESGVLRFMGSKRVGHDWATDLIWSDSLGGLMLKLKLQYFGHLMQRTNSLEKTLMLGKIEARRRGWQKIRHHWLNGYEFKQAPGVGDGQGGLACCDSWGRKESDMTEGLIWSDLLFMYIFFMKCLLRVFPFKSNLPKIIWLFIIKL